MSLVRVGLSENKKFGQNYDSIFGKKRKAKTVKAKAKPVKEKAKKKA